MKKNVAKMVIAVAMAGAMVTGQTTGVIPLQIGQMQQVQAAQVQRQTISASNTHTAVIKEDGSLWTWGSNEFGQLGDGTTEDKLTPVKVMDDVVSVFTRYIDTMAIKNDNSLWAWGDSNNGMIGAGATKNSNTPVKIMDDVVSISASDIDIMVIKNDNSLWAWGQNRYGELGDGTIEYKITPVKIMDDVVFVSAEHNYTIVIKNDGSLWTWGRNSSERLGDDTTEDRYIPIKIMDDVVSAVTGGANTMVIKNDGSLWACGYNNYGKLGDGTKENRLTPIKIMDDVVSVSAGIDHTVAIKNDGSLWTWGRNSSGQLGDGTTEDRYIPIKIMDDVVSVSAGSNYTVAIKSDNSLWTWGYNLKGQLGDGTTEDEYTPVKIMDDVVFVSAKIAYTTAIKSDNSLWIWGSNEHGKLGDGTTEDRYSPVKIMDGVMLPSGTNAITPKSEQTQQPTTPKANYIYGEEEKEVVLPTDKLSEVETIKDAQQAAEQAVASMSENDKTSVDGADKAVLFTNEAITRASVVKTSSNSIVINDEMLEETVSKANDVEQKVAQAFSDVRKIRSSSRNARIVTSSDDKISIQKENISKDIDNVEVTTNYAKVSFPAKSVSEISIENKGKNKIAVDFGNKNTTEKVQISFPNMDKNKKYIAVVDENGNAIGGKYNPITGELSAKIEKSGIYTVVDNEKNFEDIKDKSAEMQETIKLLASKGIISGTSETKFSPDKSISRAEVAAIILRTLSKLDQNADGNFSDVTKQNWYFGVAGSAKNTGIISGYPDNTFRGNIVIPKVQIVSVTSRVLKNEMNYFDVNDAEKILSVYGDSSNIAKWAKNDVALATDVNMVIRRTDSLFGGNDDMTRGDAAIILKRLFDKIW